MAKYYLLLLGLVLIQLGLYGVVFSQSINEVGDKVVRIKIVLSDFTADSVSVDIDNTYTLLWDYIDSFNFNYPVAWVSPNPDGNYPANVNGYFEPNTHEIYFELTVSDNAVALTYYIFIAEYSVVNATYPELNNYLLETRLEDLSNGTTTNCTLSVREYGFLYITQTVLKPSDYIIVQEKYEDGYTRNKTLAVIKYNSTHYYVSASARRDLEPPIYINATYPYTSNYTKVIILDDSNWIGWGYEPSNFYTDKGSIYGFKSAISNYMYLIAPSTATNLSWSLNHDEQDTSYIPLVAEFDNDWSTYYETDADYNYQVVSSPYYCYEEPQHYVLDIYTNGNAISGTAVVKYYITIPKDGNYTVLMIIKDSYGTGTSYFRQFVGYYDGSTLHIWLQDSEASDGTAWEIKKTTVYLTAGNYEVWIGVQSIGTTYRVVHFYFDLVLIFPAEAVATITYPPLENVTVVNATDYDVVKIEYWENKTGYTIWLYKPAPPNDSSDSSSTNNDVDPEEVYSADIYDYEDTGFNPIMTISALAIITGILLILFVVLGSGALAALPLSLYALSSTNIVPEWIPYLSAILLVFLIVMKITRGGGP